MTSAPPRPSATGSSPGGYEQLRDRALASFAPVLDAARERSATTVAERLDAAHRRLLDSTLTVAVCGEFKRGKSSLLNALLEEEPPLFPVDAMLATSLVTVVSHGETERIVVGLTGADGTLETREISRAEIASYVTESGDPGQGLTATMLTVETPNPRLRAGVRVVDTPGVGGVFAEHTAATTAFLPSADALLFVCDFDQPLLASEIDFLRTAAEASRTAGEADGLVVAITKADLHPADKRSQLQANTVDKLVEATGLPAAELVVVPVSAHQKRDGLRRGLPELVAESNIGTLERELWATVERRRATTVLAAALADLDAGARALVDPLEAEATALRADTTTTVTELKADAARRKTDLEALRSERSRWREDLVRDVNELGRVLRNQLAEELARVWHRARVEYLDDESFIDDPDSLVAKLVAEANLVAGSLSSAARTRTGQLQRAFSRRHDLDLETPEVAALPAPPVPPIEITGRVHVPDTEHRGWGKTQSVLAGMRQGGSLGTGAGTIAGLIIGTFLFPGVGSSLGAAIGASIGGLGGGAVGVTKSIRLADARHRREDLVARRRSIEIELEPLRDAQTRELRLALDRLVDDLRQAMIVELEGRIDQLRESTTDEIRRLGEAATATRAHADERLEAIEAQRRPLVRTRETVGRLAVAAERLGRRPAGPASLPAPASGDDLDFTDG